MTVPMDLNIHYCQTFRVRTHHPNNGNCVQILIETEAGHMNLTLFGLPRDITERLVHQFSDEHTSVDPEVGREDKDNSDE